MEALEFGLFLLSYAAYGAALAMYFLYAFTRRESIADPARRVLTAAVVLHGLDVVWRLTVAAPRLPGHPWTAPWGNWFDSFSLFAFLTALVFLLIKRRAHMPLVGIFILPWVLVALTAAWLKPFLLPGAPTESLFSLVLAARRPGPPPPAFESLWMVVHIPFIFAAYAAFGNAFGVGLAYVIQERQIKSRRPSELMFRLPSLEELDRLIFEILRAALPVFAIGVLLGSAWAHQAWGRWWGWDAKEIWSLAVGAVYGGYFLFRAAGWRGRRSAYLSMAGFAATLFTYVGVNFISRLHGFWGG
jgi:cytochrome c-type biogenesis protein CcsB